MDAETASILLQLVAVGAAEWATVFSVGILYMDIQVAIIHKLTITLWASEFQFCCMCSITCGRGSKILVLCQYYLLYQKQI
jgi:hypothetical protein